MFKTPWELEQLARDHMERLTPPEGRQHLAAGKARSTPRYRPLAQARRACGLGLIAAGERLAGRDTSAGRRTPATSIRAGQPS